MPPLLRQGAGNAPFYPGAAQISSHSLDVGEAIDGQRHDSSPTLLHAVVLLLVFLAVELHFRVPRAATEKHDIAAAVGAAKGEGGVLDMLFGIVPLMIGAPVLAASAFPTACGIAHPVRSLAIIPSVSIIRIICKCCGPGLTKCPPQRRNLGQRGLPGSGEPRSWANPGGACGTC